MTSTSLAAAPLETLPTVVRTLERCIEKGLTRSAQVVLVHGGETVASGAVGQTSTGATSSPATSYLWSCATKPLVAIVLGTLVDEGAISFDDAVGRFVPELGGPIAEITLTELLTHTAGLGDVGAQAYFPEGRDAQRGDEDASLRAIAQAPRDPEVGTGSVASYSVFSNWFLLSLVVERVVGTPCADVITARVVEPLDVTARLWLTLEEVHALDRAPFEIAWDDVASRILQRADQADGPTPTEGFEILDGSSAHMYAPGSSGVGPIGSLVSILDVVTTDATDGTERLLKRPTAFALVSPHRVGLVDTVTGNDLTWGLGFTVDHRAFSRRLSPRTFGHLGWDSSCIVFADPDRDVAAGVAFDRQLHGLDGVLRHGAASGALVADMEDLAVI